MADLPVVEVVEVDAVLDALDDPSSSEVYSALDPFSPAAVAAVAAKRALSGGEGGGGSSPGTVVPVAHPSGTTVDDTTYDDPIGGGKLTTLVVPSDRGVIAIAIEGDAFPRILLTADGGDGLYLGNGTYDPTSGANLYLSDGVLTISGPSGVTLASPTVFAGASTTLNGVVSGSSLPTSDPHVSGLLWVNSGVVTRSAG